MSKCTDKGDGHHDDDGDDEFYHKCVENAGRVALRLADAREAARGPRLEPTA